MQIAPDFSLPDQDGQIVNLKNLLGQKAIVLFFYPKDDSLICSAQVCAFRDSYQEFLDAGAQVFGISSDSVGSHKHFHEKNHLPYKLLSDTDSKVRQAYKVPATLGLIPGRMTFIIDPQGQIKYQFNSQFNAGKHISEALRIAKSDHNLPKAYG
jgi:thioredoxin-dependent peroxiredoxin